MTSMVRGTRLNASPFYVEKPVVYATASLKMAKISRNLLFSRKQLFPHYLQASDNIFNLPGTLFKMSQHRKDKYLILLFFQKKLF